MNRIAFNNVYATLSGPVLDEIRSKLTYMAPGVQYTAPYKLWRKTKGKLGWDGLVSAVDNKGKFLTGLVPEVHNMIARPGVSVELQDNRTAPTVTLGNSTVSLRPYQVDTIQKSIRNTWMGMWWPRGILQLATGAGKTEIAVAMYQMMGLTSMFIVHRTNLMHQAEERFARFGIKAGIIGNNIFDIQPDGINIATIATLNSIVKSKDDERYAPLMGLINNTHQVFFDEAHLAGAKMAGGNLFVRTSSLFTNAAFRWGLTATPFMRDGYSDSLLQGCAGSVLAVIKSAELIEQGYLAKPEVVVYTMSNPMGIAKKWPECYRQGVMYNSYRNAKVVEVLKSLPKPVMVLTHYVEHGEILRDLILKAGIKTDLVTYHTKTDDRSDALQALVAGGTEVLVVSTIFDEGINVPELKSLVFAGGMKSKIKSIQRVGRGMRLANGKTTVKIIDFLDTTAKHLMRQSRLRIEHYKQEGFEITNG